jgi:hypothetical protein
MYKGFQRAITFGDGIEAQSGSEFKVMDRVWVKSLNRNGVVQEVQPCRSGELEYYLLRVAVGGSGLFSVLADPLAVEKCR